MSISWGYSPKIEKYIPLGDFQIDRYLLVAKQAAENLGWKVSHISEKGLIAYTPISLQSYSEEVSIMFDNNFAIVKSECIGIQMLFTDYGKNKLNLDRFFHEFEYVEYHLKDNWEESLTKLRAFVAVQDPEYFEKAPLTIKNKIKNVFYLFIPQKGYVVTPILLYLNIVYFLLYFLILNASITYNGVVLGDKMEFIREFWSHIFSNNRALVLKGQVWRLFTYQFVHLYFLHLFFNMYSLVYIGLMIEHKLKSKNFIAIYLISGFCGGLTSIMMHDIGFGIGASGAVMGVFGAFLALLVSNTFEKNATKALLISTVIVTAFTLINGLSAMIDNAAHIGGLISGFILTYFLVNEKIGKFELQSRWRYTILCGLLVIFTSAVFLFTPNFHSGQFDALVEQFEENNREYHKVTEIPDDLSTLQKMKMSRKYGWDLWERNGIIVTNMQQLKLDEEHKKIRSFYEEVTWKTIKLEYVRYQIYKTRSPDAKSKFDEMARDLAKVKLAAKEQAGIAFP